MKNLFEIEDLLSFLLLTLQAFEEWGDWPEDEDWKDDKDTPVRNFSSISLFVSILTKNQTFTQSK